ncbi:MAG: HU family DNA-binding protein [bacterium]
MKSVGKTELIDEIAKKIHKTKKDSKDFIDTFLGSITNMLKRGNKVTLTGFGSFYVVKTKARKGRNPKTKMPIDIPSKKVPKFKAGAELKEAVK